MKNLMNWVTSLRPANRQWNYMEVKELSERLEMAKIQAQEAIMVLKACQKNYDQAAEAYMEQCKNARRRYAA